MQSDQACLLDLFAQDRRRSSLTDPLSDMRTSHFSSCAKNLLRNHILPNCIGPAWSGKSAEIRGGIRQRGYGSGWFPGAFYTG
jgi:hypothetical protein